MVKQHYINIIQKRLDNETGTVYKTHGGRLRFALAFPNTYFVGMSNLGFQMIYRLLNQRDDIVCERFFLPDKIDLDEMRKKNLPLLSMESQTPISDFDIIGFSLSFELDYPNIVTMLAISNIPVKSAERVNRAFPFVIAGGPAATFNPEPVSMFMDAFLIGEAEEVLYEIVDAIKERAESYQNSLLSLAQIEGVYVPSLYHPRYKDDGTLKEMIVCEGAPSRIKRVWPTSLENHEAVSAIFTPETEFSNMILAEVSRGCKRMCRYCISGYTYLPPRWRTPQSVISSIEKAESKAASSGRLHRVGLVGASVFDHPSALSICSALLEKDRLFSISSTRVDTLNNDVVNALHKGGHETLTVAPEAGTNRLRALINKNLTDEGIYQAVDTAWDGGFRRLKLYFMIGLPTETEEDVDAIIYMVKEIASMRKWDKLTVSVSCFVPKPWTPFQWVGMERERNLSGKIGKIRKSLRSAGRIELSGESARLAVSQGVLARGDRKIGDALLSMGENCSSWRAAWKAAGVEPEFYAHRLRSRGEILPWDHLDLGIAKEFLWCEYKRSQA